MYFLKKLFEKYFENNEPTGSKSTDNKNDDSKHFPESSGQLDTLENDYEKKSECCTTFYPNTMQKRKTDINLTLTLSVLIIIFVIYFIFPNLEFKLPKANRIFGISFNIFCFYIAILLFFRLKKLKNKVLKYSLILVNSIFLIITLFNFPIYLMKIDPQTQYYDIKTLYWNKENKFEKIEQQYYINWKNNQKNIVNNKVFDIGPFRNYLEYHVEAEQLPNNWVKIE